MYKKAALLLGVLYVAVSAYLLKLRIDFSGMDSARGVGLSIVGVVVSYITGIYLISSQRELNKLLGVILLLISLALLILQIWFRSYYPNEAL